MVKNVDHAHGQLCNAIELIIIMRASYCFGVRPSSRNHLLPVTLGCELDTPESVQKLKSYLVVLMRTQHNALDIHIPTDILLIRL